MANIVSQERIEKLKVALEKATPAIRAVAASRITPERLAKIALGAAMRTPLLLECTTPSIIRAVMQGAELGFEPGSVMSSCYLVPFRNNQTQVWEAQLIVSAQGFCELAYRSGLVSFVVIECVYDDDEFEYELGLNPVLIHKPNMKREIDDQSKITHAYMVVGFLNGAKIFKVMNRAQIEKIRDRSPAWKSKKSGPWLTDFGEMAAKTVGKRCLKWVPKSIEIAKAVALDNAYESGDFSGIDFDVPEHIDAEYEDKTEDVTETPKSQVQNVAERIKNKRAQSGDQSEFDLNDVSN